MSTRPTSPVSETIGMSFRTLSDSPTLSVIVLRSRWRLFPTTSAGMSENWRSSFNPMSVRSRMFSSRASRSRFTSSERLTLSWRRTSFSCRISKTFGITETAPWKNPMSPTVYERITRICRLSLAPRRMSDTTMRRARARYSLKKITMLTNRCMSSACGRGRFRAPRRSVSPALDKNLVVMTKVLEHLAGAPHDRREGILGDVHREARLEPEALVELFQERPAAGKHDAAVKNVGRQFGRCPLEREFHRVDDLLDRLVERLADFHGARLGRLRNAVHEIAALHLDRDLLFERHRGAHFALDGFGRPLADEDVVVLLEELDDRVVHLVARDADRLLVDDAREGDDGDLGRAAADVDDHVAGGSVDVESDADGGRHRFGDEMHFLRPGVFGGVAHRALLDLRHAARHADDDPAAWEPVGVNLLDELPQHPFRDLEIGDDAVAHRPDRPDVAMRAPEHLTSLVADRDDPFRIAVEGHDGGLVEDDPLALHMDQRVRGSEVDCKVRGKHGKKAH